jgi:hypothetical protein
MEQCNYIKQLEERIKSLEEKTAKEIQHCENCGFFSQHYGRSTKLEFNDSIKGADGTYFYSLNCGHCYQKYPKKRTPKDKPCEHFKLKSR